MQAALSHFETGTLPHVTAAPVREAVRVLKAVQNTNFDSDDTPNPHASHFVMPIIDWYQGTFPSSQLPQVLNELASSFTGSTRDMIRPPKGMAYRHAFKLNEGVVVCYDN